MNAPLRVNEALLITGRAFQPFECVAWAPLEGSGELSLSVVDRTCTRVLGRSKISRTTYCDPQQLAEILRQARQELSEEGFRLSPWSMPE